MRSCAFSQVQRRRALSAWSDAFRSTTWHQQTNGREGGGSPYATEAGWAVDEYDSIMNPSIFPSIEPMIVIDQHFDDVADEHDADGRDRHGHDHGHRGLHVMSSSRAFSAHSSPSDEPEDKYEYDYDEYELHMSPSQVTNVAREHLSNLDMIRHEDVSDVREQRKAWNGEDEEHGV